MANGTISEELKHFIQSEIDSVEMLEILAFLVRNTDKELNAKQIAELLYIQEESTQSRLAALVRKGLCRPVEGNSRAYRYHAETLKNDTMVKELLEAYRIRRTAVITLIFSKPDDVQLFSDAFRFRRED